MVPGTRIVCTKAMIAYAAAVALPGVRKSGVAKLISQGNEHYRKGRLGEAIKAYNQVLQIDPENPVAWNNKGLILAVAGNFNEALKCHMKAVELDPEHVDAISNVGMTYSKLEKLDEALEWYDRALELDRNHETTWNNRGNLLSKLERYDEAIICYDRALEINPNYMAAMNNKAVELIHMKKFDGALSLLNNVLKSRPLFAEGWYVKGKAYIGMGDFEKAIVCLERARRLNPDFAQAKRALDVLKKKLVEQPGDTAKAGKKTQITEREKERTEKSIQNEILKPRAESERMGDEFERPEEHLTKEEKLALDALTDEPMTVPALKASVGNKLAKPALERALEGLVRRGLAASSDEGKNVAYMKTNALGSIEEEMVERKEEQESEDSGNDLHALVSRSRKLINGERYKEAERDLKKALKINPYDDMTLCLMAQVQYEMGDRDRAINTISKILGKKPDFIPAWFTLANATLKGKEYSDSAECFRKILELQPENAEARKGLNEAEKAMK